MPVKIREIGYHQLQDYAQLSINFEVRSILRVTEHASGMGGITLHEEPIEDVYTKDYDAHDGAPESWPKQFDVRNWAFFLAVEDAETVGAVAIAYDTPTIHLLDGRPDLALVWDLRVHPDFRGRGIGSLLFAHAAEWARERGCEQLKVETQNVNVPACRFYVKNGCHLGAIHRHAYAATPRVADEVMLLWYLDL